jgi:hypothetical protein
MPDEEPRIEVVGLSEAGAGGFPGGVGAEANIKVEIGLGTYQHGGDTCYPEEKNKEIGCTSEFITLTLKWSATISGTVKLQPAGAVEVEEFTANFTVSGLSDTPYKIKCEEGIRADTGKPGGPPAPPKK